MKTKDIIKNKGITLIALVITIIVLLILAGVTISTLTGDNGIITRASQAAEETEIANEKDIIARAILEAMAKDEYGNLEEDGFQDALDSQAGGRYAIATDIGDEFEVAFTDSNRYYIVDKDGNIIQMEAVEDDNPGDITVGINGEELDGSEEKPYEIWCIEDLVAFSNMVNGSGIKLENGEAVQITSPNNFSGKYVVVKTNLNFKSTLSYQDSERTDFGDINGDESDGNTLMNEMTTGTGFKPIGVSSNFSGNFDGGGYTISNMYIANNSLSYIGLFGSVSNGTVKNCTVSGSITRTGTSSVYLGGIAGYISTSTIENCESNISIKVEDTTYCYIGGVIGYGYASGYSGTRIVNCKNNGSIEVNDNTDSSSGRLHIGGIIGFKDYCLIKSCSNTANINIQDTISTGAYIGGIVGDADGYDCIIDAYNEGNITYIGTCNGTGASTGLCLGGISGYYLYGFTCNMYNAGTITVENTGAITKVGGIGGIHNGARVTCSYNIGEINVTSTSSTIQVGGILGCAYYATNIEYNYSIGSINCSNGNVGAIAGQRYISGSVIDNNYYLESVADVAISGTSNGNDTVTKLTSITGTEMAEVLNSGIATAQELMNIASSEIIEKTWKVYSGQNNGYPILE